MARPRVDERQEQLASHPEAVGDAESHRSARHARDSHEFLSKRHVEGTGSEGHIEVIWGLQLRASPVDSCPAELREEARSLHLVTRGDFPMNGFCVEAGVDSQ